MKTLYEYGRVEFAAAPPSPVVEAALAERLRGKITLRWLHQGRVEIRATQWVGVVQIPSVGPIRVLPKLAGEQLHVLGMLAFAEGHIPGFLSEMGRTYEPSRDLDLPTLIARFLCSAASRILADGPLRDYREHRDEVAIMRGRIELRRQILRRFGQLDTVACEFEEFDHDVLENRVITHGLAVARRFAAEPQTWRLAARLYEDFRGLAPGPIPHTGIVRRSLQYDRRNARYRSAITWALAMLEGAGLSDLFTAAAGDTDTFLLDMNTLYERFLERLLRRVLPRDYVVRSQIADAAVFRGERRYEIRPDYLIEHRGLRGAVDAKYKRYDNDAFEPSDLYQLCIYAQNYPGFGTVPRSTLVYPTLEPKSAETIQFRPHGTRVAEVVMVPIQLREVVAELANVAGHRAEDAFSRVVRQALMV